MSKITQEMLATLAAEQVFGRLTSGEMTNTELLRTLENALRNLPKVEEKKPITIQIIQYDGVSGST